MPPKTVKAKRPRTASDDLQNPSQSSQETIVLEASGEDTTSLESAGHQPERRNESHHGSRRQSIVNTKTTLQNMEQEIDRYIKYNNEQRLNLYKTYSENFLNLIVMWNIDTEQAKKQGEKLNSLLKEQQEVFEESEIVQKQKIKEFKDLYEKYLKSIENYGKRHGNTIAAEIKIQMVILEKKIITETDQEESARARQSFLSLLFS